MSYTDHDNDELPRGCSLGPAEYFETDGNEPAGWYAPVIGLEGDIEEWRSAETEVCVDGCGMVVPAEQFDRKSKVVKCTRCQRLADDAFETYGRLLATMGAS